MRLHRILVPIAISILAVGAGSSLQAQESIISGVISHFNASLAFEEKGKYEDALKEMEAIPADARNDYAVILRFGWLEYLTQKHDLSEKYYRQAFDASKSKSIEALLGLTLPLAARQEWAEVEAAYQKILTMDPANYTAHLRLGQIYMNRGDHDSAETHLAKALQHYPAAYEVVLSSAWNDFSLGKREDARQLFERALMLSPGDTSALRGLSSLK